MAGGLAVAALLAGGMVLGAVVIKRAGRRAFKNLASTFQQVQQGQQPTPQQPGQGNGLTMLAGLLLMLPGLISDVAGLILLLPPVRAWIGRRATRSLERKMASAPPAASVTPSSRPGSTTPTARSSRARSSARTARGSRTARMPPTGRR